MHTKLELNLKNKLNETNWNAFHVVTQSVRLLQTSRKVTRVMKKRWGVWWEMIKLTTVVFLWIFSFPLLQQVLSITGDANHCGCGGRSAYRRKTMWLYVLWSVTTVLSEGKQAKQRYNHAAKGLKILIKETSMLSQCDNYINLSIPSNGERSSNVTFFLFTRRFLKDGLNGLWHLWSSYCNHLT